MKIHIIGAGGPRPKVGVEKYGTSCIVDIGGERIMLDCGPATTYKMARMGLFPSQVNTLFLSHHHSDHNVDFPCFALLRFDLDNGELPPLEVYGPSPTEAFVNGLVGEQGVFSPDIISRREHPVAQHNYTARGGTLPRPGIKAIGHDLTSHAVVETDTWKATALPVPHLGPQLVSFAYRIDSEEGSILYLSDAGINPSLIDSAKGVDVLITGILNWNTRLDPSDIHHKVSADFVDVIDLANGANIPKVIGIHGTQSSEKCRSLLTEGYDGNVYDGEVVCPKEMETVNL